jgi:hypothetical protein
VTTSAWLATWLDAEMLMSRGVGIVDELRQGSEPPPLRAGPEVAAELGGRLLIKYLTQRQVSTEQFRNGSERGEYATITPYTTDDVVAWLLLPAPAVARKHVLLLNPTAISWIAGPYWVASGRGIQYLLPYGFTPNAIVVPGSTAGHWGIPVH